MEEEDTESRCSIPVDLSPTVSRKQKLKVNIYNEVLVRLKYSDDVPEAQFPGFEDQLWAHFNRLPTRYALDVNVERAQDVLMHKRLLHMAHDPATRPAVQVRLVQVHSSAGSSSLKKADAQSSSCATKQSHPPPAFGLSQDLELALETKKLHVQHGKAGQLFTRPMHEITISTMDRPKLLSELTSLLSDVGLNIQEAHAFSTTDGYSLDVFVVDGWEFEETERLRQILEKQISWSEKNLCLDDNVISHVPEQTTGMTRINDDVSTPDEGKDIWEIDPSLLRYKKKIASGLNGDLYQGIFCGQDVAIKVLGNNLGNDRLNETMREFSQEVYIMRKVRHKNVVRFIGACTKPPNFCIVTEFLSGGSMYDFLHKQMGSFSLQSLLRVAIDVSRGMKYLHQNNIIHRDLKSANLLVAENGVVKVADFGIARVQAQSGVMTAETGTYRWMAPEVIEHKLYDHKADVFSFGVVLWELLTGKLPYKNLTPVQAALGVLKEGLRPSIPKDTNPMLVELMERCWQKDASLRPEFSDIVNMLRQMARMVADERDDRRKGKSAKVVPALRHDSAQ